MNFNYCNTVKLFFGANVCEQLKGILFEQQANRILFITGEEKSRNVTSCIAEQMEEFDTKVLSGVTTNAKAATILDMAQISKEFNPDVIITVGGGSVHDTGKAVSIMSKSTDAALEDYTVNGKLSVPGIKDVIPLITIPTIVGSGAEVSPAALVKIDNEKRVIFSPLLHPIATIINIEYLKELNKDILSRTAFDSFIQSIEGYLSTAANNISDAFSEKAMEYFIEYYSAINNNDVNDDILEKLSIASIFSSYVCSTASVGAIHAISDPISGRFDIHHGKALAMVAKRVLEKNIQHINEERLIKLDNILCGINSFCEDVRLRVLEKIGVIIDRLNILEKDSRIKCGAEIISSMIEESYNPDMAGNPHEFTHNEISEILKDWFE